MAQRDIDYIAKDFDSIVDALITYATTNFGPDTAANRQWTSFNTDDFSRTWLELVAYVGDLIFYYLDIEATQSTLETATLRSAVLNIAKQFGFVVATASSSSGLAKFKLNTSGTVPVGFRLAAQNGAEFFVSSSAPAPGSATLEPLIPVIQGIQRSETFTARGVQNEEFILGFTSLVVDLTNPISSLVSPGIKVNGNDYTLVNSFIRSLPSDKHFRVMIGNDGVVTLRFGDGIFGKQLSANDSVVVSYRTGGGTIGNIPSDTLTTLTDSNPIIDSVTNTDSFSGGADEPTLDQLKELIPDSLKTLQRAVTIADYGDIIEANFNNVSKAKAEQNTSDPGIDVNIYVVPAGNTISKITTNLPLFSAVSDFIDERKTVTTTFKILDAFGINIVMKMTVYLKTGASRSLVDSNIKSALSTYLDLNQGGADQTGTKFGQTILLNDIYALVDSVEGIDRFEITKLHYVPRMEITAATGTNYLLSAVELYPTADISEWLVGADFNSNSPNYNTFTVFRKFTGNVSNLGENNLTDDKLNLSIVEGTTTGINTVGGQNLIFDSAKTFLVDEFVGGSTPLTITNVTGNTWNFAGAAFIPRAGDRITQAGNTARVTEVLDTNTFVLATAYPNALIDTGPSTILKRDNYLFVDASNNVWTIDDNDSHSIALSAFAINNTIVSDVTGGAYKIVKSLIGQNILFHDLIFANIEYNTNNGIFRENSSFNLVGTIGDQYWVSVPQVNKGNFGLPVTLDKFESNTPDVGYGRIHCAGNPDLTGITYGIDSNYVVIDSNLRVFEIVGINNLAKTLDILHDATTTPAPAVGLPLGPSSTGKPAAITPRYYSDESEVSFVIGLANKPSGLGFQAIGNIALSKQTITSAVRLTGTVTVTTAEDHDLVVGQTVDIAGTGDVGFVGQFVIVSVPVLNQMTYAQAGADTSTSGGFASITGYDIADGKQFSLDDGVNPPVTFEFNKTGGVSGSNVPITYVDVDDAADIKTAIINAINGAPLLAISASDGTGIFGTDEVAFLQNDSIGIVGNNSILPPSLGIPGIIIAGMAGGIGTGHSIPTPVIPGPGETVNDFGVSSGGSVVDHFQFRISGYLNDIVNLRNSEIPQINTTDIEIDFRGGVT